MLIAKRLLSLFKKSSPKDKKLAAALKQIMGCYPNNIQLYHLAMKHASVASENHAGFKESNERLEYLGDAVLGAVVAEYLFKKYPYKPEGFLTEIRARIVNRDSLNSLAIKTGLSKLVEYEGKKTGSTAFKSIYGDAMEALIGAIYLDKGFEFCKKFITDKILSQYLDVEKVIETTTNYKSLIIEWAQKNNYKIEFFSDEDGENRHQKQFKAILFINGNKLAEGRGLNKKKAEQDAARKAYEAILLQQPNETAVFSSITTKNIIDDEQQEEEEE
ncbi:MAG: ribonuclease III [Flammeovirgaceae bacterium]|nr:ribonuclease III [Flammeovirgaceae bacterium]